MDWRSNFAKIAGSVASLGAKRIAVLALVGVTVFAAVAISSIYLTRPVYETLYTGLDSQDVSGIGNVLTEAGIPYDVSADGKTVMVRFGETSRARMLLAEKNLPRSTKAGYELFDNMGSLGLTSFMQRVTLVRALEGEVSRSIQLLKGVRAARVHIVMPKSGSFRQRNRAPSASVIIRTDSSYSFSSANAIRHLVAAAIPNLAIDNVTVMSTNGELLASGKDKDTATSRQQIGLEMSAGRQIKENISATLTPFLGLENFQVSVAVKLDTDKRKTTETTYDPASRVERSIREIKEKGSAKNANTSNTTSVDQEIPDKKTKSGPTSKNSEDKERKEKLINYEVSSKTVATIGTGYLVKNISVAAVINKEALMRLTGKDATPKERNAQKLEIEKLIQSSAGFDSKRGDKITVTVVKFSPPQDKLQPSAPLDFAAYFFRLAPNLVNGLILLAVTVVFVSFGVRPITRTLVEIGDKTTPPDEASQSSEPSLIEAGNEVPQIGVSSPQTPQAPSEPVERPNLINDVIGNVSDLPMKRLEQMIEFDEKQAASVLKQWVYEENRT